MPKELRDESADSFVPSRHPPQQLHYYGERPGGYRGGGRYTNHAGFYQWPVRAPYYPRPDFDPIYPPNPRRDLYGPYDGGAAAYHRDDYRRFEQEREFRNPEGRRNSSEERDRESRKRRHHKGSKHRHRHSRHHRNHRHKKSKRSTAENDLSADDVSELPSLTLGAEISRRRQRETVNTPVTTASQESPEPGIIEDDDSLHSPKQPSAEKSDFVDHLHPSVPVAYADNPGLDQIPSPIQSPRSHKSVNILSHSESNSSVVNSPVHSKKSVFSSDNDSDTSSGSSNSDSSERQKKSPTKTSKVRSSYATALAAKLRKNRQALVERSVRRHDSSVTCTATEADDLQSVINPKFEQGVHNSCKTISVKRNHSDGSSNRNSLDVKTAHAKSHAKYDVGSVNSVHGDCQIKQPTNSVSHELTKHLTENCSAVSRSSNESSNIASTSGVARFVV